MIAGLLLLAQVAGATPATRAALPPAESRGAGATVPFFEYEAENGRFDGTLLGPDRDFGSLAGEASGRRAVRLDDPGQAIEIVLAAPANGFTIRYALPDSADGAGLDGVLELRVAERVVATVATTSKYSWYYGKYPFSNRPADGKAHHFWDEARVLLERPLPAGTKVRIHAPANPGVAWTAVDLLDAELVGPPLKRPAGSVTVMDFGADPTGRRSAQAAFVRAIAAARSRRATLYVPPGRFRVDGHLIIDTLTLTGAGPWHSVLLGSGLGICSSKRKRGSAHVDVSNIALEGDVRQREDHLPLAAICGTFSHSTFSDMFLQHAKVGVWIDGPATGLALRRLRITDHAADGINLHRGVTAAVIEQNFVRNSGDDGIALWSEKQFNSGIAIRDNIVIAPVLANGIAVYGGRDIEVSRNLVADSVTQGGGIHLGTRFRSTPFAGSIALTDNMIVRGGSFDPNWKFGVGALWFYALERPITGADIRVRGTRMRDSSCQAIQFLGPHRVDGVTIEEMDAAGSGDGLVSLQTRGSATLRSVAVRDQPGDVEVPDGFSLIDGGGNSGWSSSAVQEPGVPNCLAWVPKHQPAR